MRVPAGVSVHTACVPTLTLAGPEPRRREGPSTAPSASLWLTEPTHGSPRSQLLTEHLPPGRPQGDKCRSEVARWEAAAPDHVSGRRGACATRQLKRGEKPWEQGRKESRLLGLGKGLLLRCPRLGAGRAGSGISHSDSGVLGQRHQ